MNEVRINEQINSLFIKLAPLSIEEESKKSLAACLRNALSDNHNLEASFNFLVSMDDKSGNMFLNIFFSFLRKTKKITTSEAQLLQSCNYLNELDIDNSVLLINNCNNEPMTEEESLAWAKVAESLKPRHSTITILIAKEETLETRFRGHDDVFYRLFRYHIKQNSQLTVEDAITSLNTKLNADGFTRTDEYDSEIKKYLDTILQKADLKGHEFIDDLYDRIIGKYFHKSNLDMILDKSCIPDYRPSKPIRELEITDQKTEIKPCKEEENVEAVKKSL